MTNEQECNGCGHNLNYHFKSVVGIVRCIGPMGPYGLPCDCIQFQSGTTYYYRKKKQEKDEQERKQIGELVSAIESKIKDEPTS